MRRDAIQEAEVAAFFALSRWILYGCALLYLCVLAGLLGLSLLLMRLSAGQWMYAAVPGAHAVLVALLYRRPAGRGALWMVGFKQGSRVKRPIKPKSQIVVATTATLAGTLLALYFTLA